MHAYMLFFFTVFVSTSLFLHLLQSTPPPPPPLFLNISTHCSRSHILYMICMYLHPLMFPSLSGTESSTTGTGCQLSFGLSPQKHIGRTSLVLIFTGLKPRHTIQHLKKCLHKLQKGKRLPKVFEIQLLVHQML